MYVLHIFQPWSEIFLCGYYLGGIISGKPRISRTHHQKHTGARDREERKKNPIAFQAIGGLP